MHSSITKVLICAGGLVAGFSPALADEMSDAFSKADLAFGATLTSNYIFRGATQTDDNPAAQGYIEGSLGFFYAGAWASNVDFGEDEPDDFEYDLYAGIRPEFGDLSLDLGYVRYNYDSTGFCCGELYAKANYKVAETFSAGGEFYFNPVADTSWAVAKSGFSGLPWELALSGQIGTDFGTLGEEKDKFAWDVGVSRAFLDDAVTFDIRYHDSNFDPARIVGSVSFETSILTLSGK